MRSKTVHGITMSMMLGLGGCGEGQTTLSVAPSANPAAPTPTPHTVLTITAGDTGRPIAGARVIVAGIPLITDAEGRVSQTIGDVGATIDVLANGYLDRQTTVRSGSERLAQLTLWPRTPLPLFDEHYTRQLVYTSSTIGSEGASSPLTRLAPGNEQIRIVLAPELANDPQSIFFHQFAADHMNTAVAGAFRFTIGTNSAPGFMNVPASVDPNGSNCSSSVAAYANVTVNSGGEITALAIIYCDARWARDGRIIVHEMGHTLGLRHSLVRTDVMYTPVGVDAFSDRELLLMKLMYQRPSGNVYPDNDRSTAGLSSAGTATIVCGR